MSASIYVFPASRRIGKIRKTAQAMVNCGEPWASKHLKQQLCYLTEGLARAGLNLDEIVSERRAFDMAVKAEVYRMTRRPQSPGGAA
jgi:hypothetical protein